MPADVPAEAGVFERALEGPARLGMGEHRAIRRAEDVLAVPGAVAKRVKRLLTERNVARFSFRNGLANDQAPGIEGDVDPTKADELAVPKTGAQRDDEHAHANVLLSGRVRSRTPDTDTLVLDEGRSGSAGLLACLHGAHSIAVGTLTRPSLRAR